MHWIRHLIRVAVWCAALTAPAHALPLDPSRDWRTLETEHFRVHFPDGLEPLARRVAAIAEDVHVDATSALGWTPRAPTHVVVLDDIDIANGYAMNVPYNLMVLYAVPPEPGSLLQVDGHDRWLEFLIAHEYTHIVHGDLVHGPPARLRRVLGRHPFTFPHLWQPLWLIEGLATHFETDRHHGVGRGESALTDMVLRTEVAAGVRPLAQVNAPNRSWPAGHVPYLYGVAFHQFLEERYGPDRIRAFLDDYASNLVPFRLDHSAERAFGRDFALLWSEFEAWLFERHAPVLQRLRATGTVDGEPVTAPGVAGLHEGGVLHATGEGAVYYVRDSGAHRPRLVRRERDGTETRIAPLNRGARFSVHPDAGIMVAQPEHCDEYRVYYDLFRVPADGGRLQRVTHCSRYRDVAWHPHGDALAVVRYVAGRSELLLVTAHGAELETLAEGGIIAHPHWSPDGTHLVVVRAQPGEGAALYEWSADTRAWRRLTADAGRSSRPRYTRDGAHILFTSDHGGIPDLRRLDRATGEVVTLTRVETGAFDAVDGPDGIHFLHYGPDGYQLRLLRTPRALGSLPGGPPASPRADEVQPADAETRRYDPLPTLVPTAWAPHLLLADDVSELGAFVWGHDALGVHAYALLAAVELERGDAVGRAAYSWAGRVFVDAERRTVSTSRGPARDETASAAWRIPFSRVEHSWSLFTGAAFDRRVDLSTAPRPPRDDHIAGAAVVYDSASRYRLSFSRQEGRHVRAIAERSLGGDFSGAALALDWREFLHVGGARVLALRYVQASADAGARPFALGGTDGDEFMMLFSNSNGLFNKRRYPLRGYGTGRALTGPRMQLVSAELRFPGALVERSRRPLGLERWGGAVFAEAGGTAASGETLRLHPAVGAELHADLTVGYRFGGLRARAGYARGLDDEVGGTNQVYLGFGAAF